MDYNNSQNQSINNSSILEVRCSLYFWFPFIIINISNI